MRARRNRRRQRAEVRANRRATILAKRSIAFGVGVGVLMLAITPPCMTTQALAAQVMRGDKINLSLPTVTNLSALTNPNFSITNVSAGATNSSSLPLAKVVTNALPASVTVNHKQYRSLSYRELSSFRFNITAEMSAADANPLAATAQVMAQIPAEVRVLSEKPVALTGFMLPVKMSEGLVTDFMLLPNQMGCCYGRMPRINDVIIVNTSGKGVKVIKHVPITVLGTFHVGAIRNNNYLIGIYQMDCERVVEASSLTAK